MVYGKSSQPRQASADGAEGWHAARHSTQPAGSGSSSTPAAPVAAVVAHLRSAQLIGHDLGQRPGAGSSRPCPQCPGRKTRCLPWAPHRPARPGRGRPHCRIAVAWHRRRPVLVVRSTARTATSRPRCPAVRQAFAGARAAASDRVSALRPQRPRGRVCGVHSDRGPVSTRTGVGACCWTSCPPSAAGPMACRAGSAQPARHPASRAGGRCAGAPLWLRATGRVRPPAGCCLGGTSVAGRGRPGWRAGPAAPRGPAPSRGG